MFSKIKALTIFCSTIGITSYYFHKKHMYDKELFNQINYLLENKIELSGVYLQERKPFNVTGPFGWLLPKHQSLKIIQKDGTIRHIGIAKINDNIFDMTAEFHLHTGPRYESLNAMETSIPIECWVDYKRKFGHFPHNINIDELNRLTLTREESTDNIYSMKCGKIERDLNNDLIITSCRSEMIKVIRTEELLRENKE